MPKPTLVTHGTPAAATPPKSASAAVGVASPARSMRFAQLISTVANPGFIAPPTLLLVALRTAPSTGVALLWWGVTTLGISAAPLLYVYIGVRRGIYTDLHLSQRSQRLVPLLVGLASTSVTLLALVALHSSRTLLASLTAVLAGGGIALAITSLARWKISLHMGGITGTVTLLVLLFGVPALVLTLLIPLVGWARWRVRAHTPAQIVAGAALTALVTLVTFHVWAIW